MTKELFVACAGAGKTQKIITDSIKLTDAGLSVLVITYTRNNQLELIKRFLSEGGTRKDLFIVKGWYSFLLEDIIRPYQRCLFPIRVPGINLTSRNPHIRGGKHLFGTGEKIAGKYNKKHFFDSRGNAYTDFISKLSCRIIKEGKVNISKRIESIYKRVYLDEVQDFSGWDFELLKIIAKSKNIELIAVGDFRQTIYTTSSNPKTPNTSASKLIEFQKMGFQKSDLNESWRSIQAICDYADRVHEEDGYAATISKAILPKEEKHFGIFYVSKSDIDSYVTRFNPLILRLSSSTGSYLQKHDSLMTFGQSKGLAADHILILPTKPMLDFIQGDSTAFTSLKTDESRNKLYVAITRARYSVAFIVDSSYFTNQLWVA